MQPVRTEYYRGFVIQRKGTFDGKPTYDVRSPKTGIPVPRRRYCGYFYSRKAARVYIDKVSL